MKKFLIGLLVISSVTLAYAGQVLNPHTGKPDIIPTVTEEDGSPAIQTCRTLKFANGNVTDNGDTSCSIADQGGGSGGDNVTVNGSAVDTTANFLDNIYHDFSLTDGGAGGPDDVTVKPNYAETLAGNPALLVDECIWAKDTSGGFVLCEGSTADTAEQAYRFPDANGSDTTDYFVFNDVTATLTNKTLSASNNVIEADSLKDADHGDFTCASASCTVDANAVALGTDTTGGYAASTTEGGGATSLEADGVDALTEIAQSIKSAADDTSKLIVGTAGSNGEIAKWTTDGTLTDNNVILGTMTDGKWCSYASSGTLLSCTQDAPAGSGDVTDVGDCTGGACLDGTSDGGTYIRLYDGDSNYVQIGTADRASNQTVNLGTMTDTKYCTYSSTGTVIDCNSSGGSGAPTDATYITQTANGSLSAEQALSSLSTGLMKVTTTTGVISSVVPGTGVETALAVNVGSSGAFVTNGGALGTPSSGTLTNATGLPISTGVSGLGTNVATFLATPSSANLQAALTDESGTGPIMSRTSVTMLLMPQGAVLDDNSPPALSIIESTGTGTSRKYILGFDASTDEIVYWSFIVPPGVTASGTLSLKLLWEANSTTANADAIWAGQISCTTPSDADDMYEDAAQALNATDTVATNVNTTEATRLNTSTLTIASSDSIASGDFCTLRIQRDADDSIGNADNDGLTVDANLLAVEVTWP